MSSRINRVLAVFLGIILASYGNSGNFVLAKDKKPQDKKSGKIQQIKKPVKDMSLEERRKELYSNSDWLKLSKIWKDTNHIDFDKETQEGYEEKTNLVEIYKDSFSKTIDKLKTSELLTDQEYKFLTKLYTERAKNILPVPIGVTCYLAAPTNSKNIRVLEDFEKQQDLLESLLREGKINTDTYSQATRNISRDIYRLYPEAREIVIPEKAPEEGAPMPVNIPKIKDELLELIININK